MKVKKELYFNEIGEVGVEMDGMLFDLKLRNDGCLSYINSIRKDGNYVLTNSDDFKNIWKDYDKKLSKLFYKQPYSSVKEGEERKYNKINLSYKDDGLSFGDRILLCCDNKKQTT